MCSCKVGVVVIWTGSRLLQCGVGCGGVGVIKGKFDHEFGQPEQEQEQESSGS